VGNVEGRAGGSEKVRRCGEGGERGVEELGSKKM